jgi:hypothetical protein
MTALPPAVVFAAGATLRFSPPRLGRITMFGQLTGAALGVLVLAVGLIAG